MNNKINIGIPNMRKISSNMIGKVVMHGYDTKRIPILFGAPGVGKSKGTESAAKKIAENMNLKYVETPKISDWNKDNFCFLILNISQLEEYEFKGLPKLVESNDRITTIYSDTELIPTDMPDAHGIILVDEFSNARRSVQDAMQTILLDKKVGNKKIPEGVCFIIAGNRPEDGCLTEISPANQNRFAWYEVVPNTYENHSEFMRKIVGRPIENRLDGFMLSIGDKFWNNYNPNETQYTFLTPRSLDIAGEEINGITDYDDINLYIGGRLGEQFANEFTTFLQLSDKVDMNELLKHPEIIKRYDNDVGMLYSICLNLLDKVEDKKHTDNVLRIIDQISKKEFGIFMLTTMVNRFEAIKFRDLLNTEVGMSIIKKYGKLLED